MKAHIFQLTIMKEMNSTWPFQTSAGLAEEEWYSCGPPHPADGEAAIHVPFHFFAFEAPLRCLLSTFSAFCFCFYELNPAIHL